MLPPLILYTQVLLLHSLVEEEQRGDHTGCNEIHLKNTSFMDLLCSDAFCKGKICCWVLPIVSLHTGQES